MMLKAKLRGQGKAKPVDKNLTVKDHPISSSDGNNEVKITVRSYIPHSTAKDLPGML